MKIIFKKNIFKIIYWSFILALCFVVFIRDQIDNMLIVTIINYFFWYSFGLSSGVFITGRINKAINKSNDRSKV